LTKIDAAHADLREIAVDLIRQNPENPRLVFRSGEFEELVQSIGQYGVQVPISVYRKGRHYVLIDGERRWRCCVKLNMKTVPALVQAKPDSLTNLLLMFNIHALREQWDLLTIAMKLPRVMDLLARRLKRQPTERELRDQIGVSLAVIRRSKLLIDLPAKYRSALLDELSKPKSQHQISEDLFIEMERSLKTVERAMPALIDQKNRVRDVLLAKYKNGIIKNVTDFRKLSKIARAERVGIDKTKARRVIADLFRENTYSIQDAFDESVSGAYSERDLVSRVGGLLKRLKGLTRRELDPRLRSSLEKLHQRLSELLGPAK
jgi:ParB/RepB/Spo0J family partition protein